MYTDKVYEHFMNPENAYLMPNSNGEGQVGNVIKLVKKQNTGNLKI